MAEIDINPWNYQSKRHEIGAGDTVHFRANTYREPIVLEGVAGTRDRPVILTIAPDAIKGQVVLTSGFDEEDARKRGNRIAWKRQESGYYPTVGHLGEMAQLVLRRCQHVYIDNLSFRDCWPTGIFLDNSKYIAIQHCDFIRGTIAISTQGIECHDVVIQNCSWVQDTSTDHKMWNEIPWDRIHGASNNSDAGKVCQEDDYRHWDGDFVRGWNVGNNFTIRNNMVRDAFNGIHFFNTHDQLPPGQEGDSFEFNGGRQSTANFLIEGNEFTRIRDNVFEPEYHAWNWVIRHNRMLDCFRPFSFEFERAGWFYIYGNEGSFVRRPSQKFSQKDKNHKPPFAERRNPSMFKLNGSQLNEGPIHVFNNSWYFVKGKGLFPKRVLTRLQHNNNLMGASDPDEIFFFGTSGINPVIHPFDEDAEREEEESRFTKQWNRYSISMDGDLINDAWFPSPYRSLGFDLGAKSKNGDPCFEKPVVDIIEDMDLTARSQNAIKTSVEFVLELPNGNTVPVPAGANRGAVQDPGAYELLEPYLSFLPDTDWVPEVATKERPETPPKTSKKKTS